MGLPGHFHCISTVLCACSLNLPLPLNQPVLSRGRCVYACGMTSELVSCLLPSSRPGGYPPGRTTSRPAGYPPGRTTNKNYQPLLQKSISYRIEGKLISL